MEREMEMKLLDEKEQEQVYGGKDSQTVRELTKLVSKTCPNCGKIFIIKTAMDQKYYDAHVKKCGQ